MDIVLTPRLQASSSLGNLPEEILLQILDESTLNITTLSDGAYYPKRVYSELRSLALVCRRFYRLATPFLFEDITFYHETSGPSSIKDCSIVPPCRRALALHRVLHANPPLRSKCLSLEIIIDDTADTTDEDFQVASDLVSWLSRTRSLRFYGGFHEESTPNQRGNALALISTASQSMPSLKEFLIDGDEDTYRGLSLAEAMENIRFPSLEILAMSANGPSDSAQLSRIINSEKSHTASFTSLTLKYCKDTPEAIEKFISWPNHLVDFTINTSGNKLVGHISLMDAQRWLSNYKDTLEYMYIDLLGHDQGLYFDASIFPNLKGLRLSRTQLNDEDDDGWNTDLRWEPSHADRLLSLNLKTFGMSFGILGCCLINNFGEKEVNWLRQLGQAAASRKSGLETIEILFNPLSAYPHKYGSYPEDYGYPWDRIQGLSEELAKCGINLVYNSPPWTKEEWERKIARWLAASAELLG